MDYLRECGLFVLVLLRKNSSSSSLAVGFLSASGADILRMRCMLLFFKSFSYSSPLLVHFYSAFNADILRKYTGRIHWCIFEALGLTFLVKGSALGAL